MKNKLLLGLLGGLFWSSSVTALSLFGFGEKPFEHFQAHAPAETILYFEGKVNAGVEAMYSNPASAAEWESLFQEMLTGTDADDHQSRFFLALLNDLVTSASSGADLKKRYGLSDGMEMAVYLDGLMPVLQFAVKDSKVFLNSLQQLEQDNEYPHQELQLNGHSVWEWRVGNESESPEIYFAVSAEKKYVTLGFVLKDDSDTRKMQRLGLAEDPNTLADSNKVSKLKSKYGFGEQMAGFVDLVEVAKVLLEPEKNNAGKDLLLVSGGEFGPLLADNCSNDVIAMVSGAPRVVAGYKDLKITDNTFKIDFSTLLEVADGQSATDLQKLNGHLSPAASLANGQMASLALGLDMANLTPVISNFWDRFVQADFQCDDLKALQVQAQQMNPATISFMTAMVQGLKGASVQLFDLQVNDDNLLSALDAVIAFSSTNPSMLVGLLSNAPFLKGVRIPEDGTPVDIELPDLPEQIQVKAAIKGSHLVLFSGKQATAAVDNLAKESLNSNGIYSLAMDYSRLSSVAEDVLRYAGTYTEADPSRCADVYVGISDFKNLDLRLQMQQGFNSNGMYYDVLANGKGMKNPEAKAFNPNRYHVSMLDWSCQWVPFGSEEMKKDGTGSYAVQDDDGQCDVYKADYQWHKEGNVLVFAENNSLSRDSCEQDFETVESDSYECAITYSSSDGFECLIDYGDGEKSLYRYTIQ